MKTQPTSQFTWLIFSLAINCLSANLLSSAALAQATDQLAKPDSTKLESTQLPQAVDVFLYAPPAPKSIEVWNTREPSRLSGTIEDLNDQKIIFTEDGKRRELPSDRVMAVEPIWRTSAAKEAHTLFAERRYREAKTAIQKAVDKELPRWQQRLLVAEIVDTVSALGENRIAGGLFLASLAPNQPPAMLYRHLPMNWTTAEPDRATLDAAAQWLESKDEHAQLLGASWLLLGSEQEAARQKLLKLQSSKLEPIAALAVAQAWRLVPPPETAAKLPEWFEYRDRLLQPLQIGPTEFLADRLARAGRVDLAIGQWSRIASVHSDRPHRVAAALASAQQLLEQQGRLEESKRFAAWLDEFKPAP